MRGDVLGAIERRRRWRGAEKFAVVCEVGRHGASVTQHHDLRRRQMYAWRRDLRKTGLFAPEDAAVFRPVEPAMPSVAAAQVTATIAVPMVEIVLQNGRQIRCQGGIGDGDLARLIRLVEAA